MQQTNYSIQSHATVLSESDSSIWTFFTTLNFHWTYEWTLLESYKTWLNPYIHIWFTFNFITKYPILI